MTTREEVKRLLKVLAANYSNFDITPEIVSIWDGILSDTEYEDLSAAVLQCIKGADEFAPKPGALRKLSHDFQFVRTGKPVSGEHAWDMIIAIIVRNRHDPDKRRANAEAAKIGLEFQVCIKSFGYGRIRECVWPAQQGRGLTTAEVAARKRDFVAHWKQCFATKITSGEQKLLEQLGVPKTQPRLTDGAWQVYENREPMKIGDVAQKLTAKIQGGAQ